MFPVKSTSLSIVETTCRRFTINIVSRAYCGAGVTIHTEQSDRAEVGVLVMKEKPLGYDLLIKIEYIQLIRGAVIMPTEDVQQFLLKNLTSVLLLIPKKKRPGLRSGSGP